MRLISSKRGMEFEYVVKIVLVAAIILIVAALSYSAYLKISGNEGGGLLGGLFSAIRGGG